MSILNRLSIARHLDDAALAAIWTDASVEDREPSDAHLRECAQCRARMAAFNAWMDELRLDGVAEADEAFSAERLAVQHAHILRRIEAAERPARVITFPTFSRPMSQSSSHMRRWITAAAAAGLIIGVALGQVMDLRQTLTRRSAPAELGSIAPPRSDRPAGIQTASVTTPDPDAAFMAEVDASVSRHSLGELRAIDEFTPRAPLPEGRQ